MHQTQNPRRKTIAKSNSQMEVQQENDQENNQDRRLKPVQGGDQNQQQQPQKCPRCESLNTKFCYYNNYSLSQPRYFCKTCRRYWTQGGTLRNVPVGGGCRKGKRTKSSSSSSGDQNNSMSQPPPPQEQNLSTQQAIISTNSGISPSPIFRTKDQSGNLSSPAAISSMASFYPGGGFLSPLAAIQALNRPPTFNQPMNQALNVGAGDHHLGGGSSNLGLLQGYNVNLPSFGSQLNQQTQFYQMGNREKTENPMYPSQESLIQSSLPAGSSQPHDWHQSFINRTNPTASDTALWSTISTSSSGNTNINTSAGSSSLINANQWPDLPGYGPPS